MKEPQNFLSYVEISTKLASIVPFLVGVGFALYRFGSIRPWQTFIFFIAMFLFDMTTTAINNHVGHRETGRKPHYPSGVSIALIFSMGTLAAVLGIYLAYMTDIVVLLAGVFCFAIGIIYSYGPLPISRTPFGELFTTVEAIIIPFIAVQISHPLINISFARYSGEVVAGANGWDLLAFVIVTAPLACSIANIMLANNICDLDEDEQVKRYTLPFFIGAKQALHLYALLYIVAFVFIGAGVLLGIMPLFSAVTAIIAGWVVRKNVVRFFAVQDKGQTFFTSIINFLIICVPHALWFWAGWLLELYSVHRF